MSFAKIIAFKEMVESGKMKTNSIMVYRLMQTKPRTIAELRDITTMPHQTLTATIRILEEMGWLFKGKTVKVNKKSYTEYHAETELERAKRNAMLIEQEKFLDWIEKGKRSNWFQRYAEFERNHTSQ